MIHRPIPSCLVEICDQNDLARTLCAMSEAGHGPVALISSPGAAGYCGVAWWHELVGNISDIGHILDCGGLAGRASQALVAGQKWLVFDEAAPQSAAIIALGQQSGATILGTRPPSISARNARTPQQLAGLIASTLMHTGEM